MGTIECPVCTLYLRADMSLEEHLGTHPMDKVIKALVSLATKPPSTPPPFGAGAPAAAGPSSSSAPAPTPIELAMMAMASSSRSRTPPNALTYHTSPYEQTRQSAPPPPPPPPAPAPIMAANSMPTAITVVKASDVGYPINNVMIVKSCSTKYVQQVPHGSGTSGAGSSPTTATYSATPVDTRNVFIDPDRGGALNSTAALTVRRQIASSLYPPRYTNERYSGPPPPYSTAISSTVSTNTQLQQSSITGLTSKYEHKSVQQQQQQHQQSFSANPPQSVAATVMHTVPTIAIAAQHQQQHVYHQAQSPPPPPPPMQQPAGQIHQQQQFQPSPSSSSSSFKPHSFLQAQYTENDDGNFLVTEKPKKIVEYTENDEGGFMVVEKIVKSPPRVVQIDEDEFEPAPSTSKQEALTEVEAQEQQDDDELIEYRMEEDEEEEEADREEERFEPSVNMEPNTIEIIEEEDGTFNDNRGSSFGAKEMPKPMLISSIGSSKNKFSLILDSSPTHGAGSSSSGMTTPRRRPASGLKVLSNVKVTTDLSQGIKDIILNLNSCKNKTTSVAGCGSASSVSSASLEGIKTTLIAGAKPAAVVNNNCQNELIINAGSNMPPIDLNNVNDIEIINDDEEDICSDEEDECYVGSMEVKATNVEGSRTNKDHLEPSGSPQNTSRATPTPSVITSVIRMTPHASPVVPPSPPPPPAPQPTLTPIPMETESPEPKPEPCDPPAILDTTTPIAIEAGPSSSSQHPAPTDPIVTKPLTMRRPPPISIACPTTSGLLFNKPPKKLTVKLKTPLPPAPPPTPPPLLPSTPSTSSFVVVPKMERNTEEEEDAGHQHHNHAVIHQEELPDVKPCKSEILEPYGDAFDTAVGEGDYSTVDQGPSQITKQQPPDEVAPSYDTITTVTSTKVEKDGQLTETVVFTQSSNCGSSASSTRVSTPHSTIVHDHGHEMRDASSMVTTATTSTTTSTTAATTTTEVECFNITFLDDVSGALSTIPGTSGESRAVAVHTVVAQNMEICNDGAATAAIVKRDLEETADRKTNVAESCNIEITEIYSLTPYNPALLAEDSEQASSPEPKIEEQPETIMKSRIKVEQISQNDEQHEEEVPPCSMDVSIKKVEHKVEKIEPTATVTSVSTTAISSSYQNDQKDFLEAGPSRAALTTASVDSNSASAASHSSRMGANAEPTFLAYSAEYDDYVPVSGYGTPQEQIPLSWVQKFSPQYTPFDDQNSYMDLDMCSSKNNSNSAGGNSHGTSSGASGSRIDAITNSMDRAPSAESLNIRTDEKMPAKGEISEQESNGDMELSWNRLYPVHENIPIYPSSYDLSTAQECWNLSNRHSSSVQHHQQHHNSNHSNSNSSSNHATLAGPSSSSSSGAAAISAATASSAMHPTHQHHHLTHSSSFDKDPAHQSHGMSFQFAQHDQPRHGMDDQVDDKSKIHLDYAGGSAAGAVSSYAGLGASGSSRVLEQQDEASRKLAKIRTYRCSECPKSFATLKQRRTHMLSEHEIESKVNVLGSAAVASATVTSAGVSSTVTSASAALTFFSSPGEGCSSSLLSKKIKMEPQPILMSYSSLKQELELKQEGSVAGPSNDGVAAASSSAASASDIRRKRTYVCGTCKQEFGRFKLFNAHLMIHPAECYTCGRSFKHWPNFALHIKRHLGIKEHQCRLCGKRFVIKQKLIEHMRVHTGKAPIKCPDCDQHFRRFSNLAQHRNRHHLNKVPSKKDFVCHCGEVFQSKAKMEWHKEIHENKPKSCPFCREKFIHKNSLTRHIRLSHTEKYVKLETATEMCTICNQPYIKTSMKRHMETHGNERMAFSCTICNKVFSTNWNLKQHRWTHANPTLKPFQCNMCSSGFVREADYITHMNAHKSIRPYTCNHCGCQFIRKYNWIRHTREHETDKNYTCEICNRKFHRKYYLTEHKRIHTGERPFSCNICGKTSSTKTNHNKHIKIHHARDPLTAEG